MKTKKVQWLNSRDEAEETAARYAVLAANTGAKLAEMNQRLNLVRLEYAEALLEMELAMDEARQQLEGWALENVGEWGPAKSIELRCAFVAVRTGMHQVKPAGGRSWAKVLETIRATEREDYIAAYIRTAEEVNRAQLIADRETLGKEKLKTLGVKIVQDEDVNITIKAESVQEV